MTTNKTCFVVIGYGEKTDYPTGRSLNLDKTYEHLILPVFKNLGIDCFRAIDKKKDLNGMVDSALYSWLLKSDIVIVDISTTAPNVFYELGVRHALRPYSTIIIGEEQTVKPFDVNHVFIEPYKHMGEDIGYAEVSRFQTELQKKVLRVLKQKTTDSPIYQLLPALQPPKFSNGELEEIRKWQHESETLSTLIAEGEEAKKNLDFAKAVQCFSMALEKDKHNAFLMQRLALVTYKSELPDDYTALENAKEILSRLKPHQTTDPETLGLMGAIYKRLYYITQNIENLNIAITFYFKGFSVKNDYYNGINTAFLFNLRALQQTDTDEAVADFVNALRIRKRVIEICKNLINQPELSGRTDKNWIFFTLAEAYLGIEDEVNMHHALNLAAKYSTGKFDKTSFNEQANRLKRLIREYKTKYNHLNYN